MPKYQMYCEQCRFPIAGFDSLTRPLTKSQFVDWHPDGTLPAIFGGLNGTWETFTCPVCKRWPFFQEGSPFERKHPDRIRTGYDNKKTDWYIIPGFAEAVKLLKCPYPGCGFSTNYDSSLKRHINTQHKDK